jgi:hypothetical protein
MMDCEDDVTSLIEEAGAEYARNEMDDPVLLDVTSEMDARNSMGHLRSWRWDDALKEAQIAAGQRDTWRHFLEIVTRIHGSVG